MADARKILTLNAISARGLARLPEHYTVGGDIADPDGILVRSANMHDMDIPATVRAIGRAGALGNPEQFPGKRIAQFDGTSLFVPGGDVAHPARDRERVDRQCRRSQHPSAGGG